MADSSYTYRDVGSFCHRVFKQNVISAIRLSFLAALSQPREVQWQIVLPANAFRLLCACAFFSHVLHLCLTAAHITLNCPLCSSTRQSRLAVILVCECVREVLSVRGRPIHFTFLHHHLLYLRGSPAFVERRGQFVSVRAFPSFSRKKNARFVTISLFFYGLFSCSAHCSDSKCLLQTALAQNQHGLPSRLSCCALKHKSTGKY